MISKKRQLAKIVESLRDRLWMQHWYIDVGIMAEEDIDTKGNDKENENHYGSGSSKTAALCGSDPHRRNACILVSDKMDPEDYPFLVAHELIHAKLEPLFQEFELNKTFILLLEQTVDDVADALTGGRIEHIARCNQQSK